MRVEVQSFFDYTQRYISFWWMAPFILTLFFYGISFASVTLDTIVNTDDTTHNGTTLTVAFTSDQTGYAFYRDSGGECVYKKTTNGGVTWSATPVVIDPQTDCVRIAIWYDRWTPGNSTGTRIHVVTFDTSVDELWYTYLDTATDATTTVTSISSAFNGTYSSNANIHAMTVATDGTIYAGIQDNNASFVVRCSSNCTNGGNWSEAGTGSTVFDQTPDWLLLAPLPNANILAVRFDLSADDIQSKIWTASTSSWSATWTNIDTLCSNNTTYDGHFGLTINDTNKDIYLAYACDVQTIGGNDDDIRTAIYQVASSTWINRADILTNTTYGVTGVKLGLDLNSGNIYAVYSAQTTAGTANTANVYYKVSTTSMQTWGPEQGPLNSTTTDIYGLRMDGLNDDRIYATWVDGPGDRLEGETVADLVITTFEQSGFRVFQNQASTSVGYAYAPANASTSMSAQGVPFRLRMLTHATGEGADVNALSLKLQYASTTFGGCDTAFSGETYYDVQTNSGDIRFYDNVSATHGSGLTASSGDPIHGIDTIVNQTYVEANPFTNSVAKIFGGQDGKWDIALVDYNASNSLSYCFRLVESDGTLFTTYSFVPELRKNNTPSIGTITLNNNNSIALIEASASTVYATATITDLDGYADLSTASGKLFRSGTTSSCSINDENSCEPSISCTYSSCAGNTCTLVCRYSVLYHADPTDVGTPWASENWITNWSLSDIRSGTTTATSSGVELLTLVAFDVNSTIPYGSLSPGSTTAPFATSTILNTGNASLDMTLYGTNMTAGANSIPVGQQRYATSTAVSYAQATPLVVSPGTLFELNSLKTTASSSTQSTDIYWGISIPTPQATGDYTGQNTFIAGVNGLPWP